ncbi:MAG: hypothetical protein M1818_003234 [Claussenomyces sp. TS43310]|nr:MAG: hypothetical protein M1818_003234 [Claussenomyces sp. TS43310]
MLPSINATKHLPSTNNTAPVIEFRCLYTADLRRKQKRWQDGRLKFHTFNRRVMVYDERSNFVGDTHWRQDHDLEEGEEVELERGGIIVQVADRTGTQEQDLSELLDKRVRDKENRASARSGASSPLRTPPFDVRRDRQMQPFGTASDSRPKSLNDVLGPATGHFGRAAVPTLSPYRARHEATDNENDQPLKRRKGDVHSNKSCYSQNLTGASLILSGQLPNPSRLGLDPPSAGSLNKRAIGGINATLRRPDAAETSHSEREIGRGQPAICSSYRHATLPIANPSLTAGTSAFGSVTSRLGVASVNSISDRRNVTTVSQRRDSFIGVDSVLDAEESTESGLQGTHRHSTHNYRCKNDCELMLVNEPSREKETLSACRTYEKRDTSPHSIDDSRQSPGMPEIMKRAGLWQENSDEELLNVLPGGMLGQDAGRNPLRIKPRRKRVKLMSLSLSVPVPQTIVANDVTNLINSSAVAAEASTSVTASQATERLRTFSLAQGERLKARINRRLPSNTDEVISDLAEELDSNHQNIGALRKTACNTIEAQQNVQHGAFDTSYAKFQSFLPKRSNGYETIDTHRGSSGTADLRAPESQEGGASHSPNAATESELVRISPQVVELPSKAIRSKQSTDRTRDVENDSALHITSVSCLEEVVDGILTPTRTAESIMLSGPDLARANLHQADTDVAGVGMGSGSLPEAISTDLATSSNFHHLLPRASSRPPLNNPATRGKKAAQKKDSRLMMADISVRPGLQSIFSVGPPPPTFLADPKQQNFNATRLDGRVKQVPSGIVDDTGPWSREASDLFDWEKPKAIENP